MLAIRRSLENPILLPKREHSWEAEAAFNPSVAQAKDGVHIVYRAVSATQELHGVNLEVSSIGHAVGRDGIHFKERKQLIVPTEEWEKFGCEDPRITAFEDGYVIFYTALSKYPFSADGIKVAVAITKDFKTFEKHLVTPFNAKAMALFPERINGKIAALLTVHTDMPPVKICLALFDRMEDLWSEAYWKTWYGELDANVIGIERGDRDQIEVGSPPLKTAKGWLIFYSYIYNYFTPPAVFGVQAALLDLGNPLKIIGEVKRPFLVTSEEYERYGKVPNIIFPSGALAKKKTVYIYYGAADTTSCVAALQLDHLVEELLSVKKRELNRFWGNPIIEPMSEHRWEAKATFNPAAVYEGGKVHILYRAMSEDNTSVMGYASSIDGMRITERLLEPVYVPREDFETKRVPDGNSGCEDPRLTRIGDTFYMCYTAFDGKDPPRVALTSISVADFMNKKWDWKKPVLISPPGADDKDAALFPKKIQGKYALLHRLGVDIWIDFVDDLRFESGKFLGGRILLSPRETAWDSKRIGIAGPPIETERGWLLLYHGISRRTGHYNVRAVLLDGNDPTRILYRIHDAMLEPTAPYEKQGVVPNVVFPCGAVTIKDKLFVYYGGADRVVGVATIGMKDLTESLLHEARFHKGQRA
jgi:beta-1,2-mannobiose phosphorylase / 1,2-beta-oligomannan phosphorylase